MIAKRTCPVRAPLLAVPKRQVKSRGASSQRDWLGSAADTLSGLFHLFLLLPFHPIATPRNTQRVGGVLQRIRFAKSIKVTAAFARTPLVWGLPLPSTARGRGLPSQTAEGTGTEGRLILSGRLGGLRGLPREDHSHSRCGADLWASGLCLEEPPAHEGQGRDNMVGVHGEPGRYVLRPILEQYP